MHSDSWFSTHVRRTRRAQISNEVNFQTPFSRAQYVSWLCSSPIVCIVVLKFPSFAPRSRDTDADAPQAPGPVAPRSHSLAELTVATAALAQGPDPGTSPDDIDARVWFPSSPLREFVVGKHIGAVIGVRNVGADGFNVSAVQGSLALVSDPSVSVLNFTGTAYQYPELKQGEEIAVQYFMPLHHTLPTRQFYLHLNVYSEGATEGELVIKQAFNGTIDLIEEPKWFDLELLGLYAVLFGILGLIAWGVRDYAIEKGLIGGSKVTKKSAGTTKSAVAKRKVTPSAGGTNEWLKGTIADKSKTKKK